MIPVILDKRKSRVKHGQTFNKLIKYVEANIRAEQQIICQNQNFEDILNYTACHLKKLNSQEKCIAIRTHGVTDLASASIEMNAVSARNTRCKDPAFHFVLAWPEHEHPHADSIFDAAEHAIKSLGLADHQYVLAIHVDTDNIHCHAAVNRIHPDTFKSRNIEWANKTIHLAARQSEIRHGWAHDNGIYIVKIDEHNKKSIVLNPEHDHTISRASHKLEQDGNLPTWHDPSSLDSWLKFQITGALKKVLPTLTDWHALHVWLGNHDITLTDTGGGGMRLQATSHETGEVVDLPASKGLRILKRSELEKRWGKFTGVQPIPCIVPDLSHLDKSQIANSVNRFLKASFDEGIPPEHIIRAIETRRIQTIASIGDLGAGETDSRGSLKRDNSKRKERHDHRAADRADLRHRFLQYQHLVREGDVDYFERTKEIRTERSQLLKGIRKDTKAAKLAVSKDRSLSERLYIMVAIDFEYSHLKLEVEAIFQEKWKSLRTNRLAPLGWREWLHEQSNLGDQSAISALRGIVYQAQRDAKRSDNSPQDYAKTEIEANTKEYRELQFRKVMARLLEEEKKEAAIRSARSNAMRPFEVDALLIRYVGMQWHVTGNGNIAYSDQGGEHLFTDRGNRVTFDRVQVSDEDIRLALVHAQQKFGKQLTLTGEDHIFTARMACLADDMGITILNPELQTTIANHRDKHELQGAKAQGTTPALNEPTLPKETEYPPNYPAQREGLFHETTQANNEKLTVEEFGPEESQVRLRAMVLAIDPHAKFVTPDTSDCHTKHSGPVVTTFTAESLNHGFAQHIGRSVYVLHPANAPEHHNNASIVIQYRDSLAIATIPDLSKGKTR